MNWRTKWGSDDDRRAVMHFKARFAALGLPPDRIERILNAAAANAHLLEDPVKATEWFSDYAGRTGLSFDDATAVEAVFRGTIDNGITAPAALGADELSRMRELEKLMGEGRHSEYWRDQHLQNEYADLTLRREASGASSIAPPADAAARSTRRTEIERMMRDDPRSYFRDEQIQSEYRSILESESPAVSSSAGDGVTSALAPAVPASPLRNAPPGAAYPERNIA